MRFSCLILLALLSAFVLSCGGGGSRLAASSPEAAQSDFQLTVLLESLVDGAQVDGFDLAVRQASQDMLVEVQATGAAGLKALYFELAYDAAAWHPLSVEPLLADGGAGQPLALSVLSEPGIVYSGQVLASYSRRAGRDGELTLARVHFARGAAPPLRQASAVGPPVSLHSVAQCSWDTVSDTLSWLYFNNGDYDQNGEVGIADLTPIGLYYGAMKDNPIVWPTCGDVIDGDGNGEINLADLTPIGANFHASALGGYNVYESLSEADVPSIPAGDNGPGASLVAHVSFDAALGNAAQGRLHFELQLTAPTPSAIYWVRPTDGETDGIASNWAEGDPALPLLALASAPLAGDGTEGDPYVVGKFQQYAFTLTDELDGNVSASADAVWSVDPPEAGSFADGVDQKIFTIAPGFAYDTGFTVSASYLQRISNPEFIYLRTEPAPALYLLLDDTPISGLGTSAAPYVVGTGRKYFLTLVSTVDGEVGTNAGTSWTVAPPEAATVDMSGAQAQLLIAGDVIGDFQVGATYNALISEPQQLFFQANWGLEIYPDPADSDWPVLSPADPEHGHDFPYYVLPNDNALEYSLLADDDPAIAGPSGTPLDVASLTWDAFPASFIVGWVSPGTFTSNSFTNGHVAAQDEVLGTSNPVYVERQGF